MCFQSSLLIWLTGKFILKIHLDNTKKEYVYDDNDNIQFHIEHNWEIGIANWQRIAEAAIQLEWLHSSDMIISATDMHVVIAYKL